MHGFPARGRRSSKISRLIQHLLRCASRPFDAPLVATVSLSGCADAGRQRAGALAGDVDEVSVGGELIERGEESGGIEEELV
ncbi:MAG TPA: hypothetical protein VHY91_26320, partial [Pirellulales bacterium]|nr:hypothetical protein [Pirellulales bacterium]